ncbi:hypothetical protein NIT62_12920 [Mammaliicoccus sciuri]|nr:hypothetical protein [Mammaliicoccus sciuri]AVE17204.1 RadC [Mammaliicoccus sciuri]AVE17222.1 RadC [Mammaliicoccus sciuri]MEB6341512.1 hypothetical protein [Mammaliicoccus sciuri]UTI87182.1 hypothetical protein NIT62_12920 [Mammaliicoccus sciuri]
MGIDLLDHIIIGDGEFISIFENDYIMREDLEINNITE